jgi:hypothetical protein
VGDEPDLSGRRLLRTIAASAAGRGELLGCHWPLCRNPAEIAAFLNETEVQHLATRAAGRAAAHPEGAPCAVLLAIGLQMGAWPRAWT